MSYDLLFFKHKSNERTIEDIKNYLSTNLTPASEFGNQWFFENEETDVYFSFDFDDPKDTQVVEEMPEGFDEFENTGISFYVNFMRPAFFGIEAFEFVQKFITDLDLFVHNPQADDDSPGKPSKDYLFANWNKTNIWSSKEQGSDLLFFPEDKSNDVWSYNIRRKKTQEEIGSEYFVSRIFLFEEIDTSKVVTLSTWTENIPNVLPITEYYLLYRKYKRFFKQIEDKVVLTNREFQDNFGKYFEEYSIKNTIVIHPDKANSIRKIYNKVRPTLKFDEHLKRISTQSFVNYR